MAAPGEVEQPPAGAAVPAAGAEPAAAANPPPQVVDVDLTAPGIDESAKSGLPPPQANVFNLDEVQEKTRGQIAGWLVALLFVIVLAAFASLWAKAAMADLKQILELLVAPVIALVGTATGFYFGGKK